VTRILLQDAIRNFYRGNISDANWTAALNDVSGALASGGFSSLVQTIVYSRNSTGNSSGLLRATADTTGIQLPDQYPNGTHAMLGDDSDLGYPTELYPNITYNNSNVLDPADPTVESTNATAFLDFPLNATSALLLGKRTSEVVLVSVFQTDFSRTPANQRFLCAGIPDFTDLRQYETRLCTRLHDCCCCCNLTDRCQPVS
jgi:hypothetical protein